MASELELSNCCWIKDIQNAQTENKHSGTPKKWQFSFLEGISESQKIVKMLLNTQNSRKKAIQLILWDYSNQSRYFLGTNEGLLTHTTLRPLCAIPVNVDAQTELDSFSSRNPRTFLVKQHYLKSKYIQIRSKKENQRNYYSSIGT